MIYDKIAARYDRAIAPLERRFLSRWREETLSLLPANPAILEIGAGTGLNFRFYPECREAIASEISIKMILLAKEKTDSISLVQADAESLPFGEHSFDAAFATLVFCSIPDPCGKACLSVGLPNKFPGLRPRGLAQGIAFRHFI